MAKAKTSDGGEPALKRLGGGRWQTRDERFTIEPQSGTWVVVDAEQTDDLGLALVRGPFRSLTDAKAGIEAARATAAPASPLTARIAERRTPAAQPAPKATAGRGAKRTAEPPAPPPEPRWIGELTPAGRRRARRSIDALEAAGIRDGEGIARRDLVGDVPAIAAAAITERLADLVLAAEDDADSRRGGTLAADVATALADGHDAGFDVRWRLVDDDGRPIHLSAADLAAAIERRRTGTR
jgi:pyruvate/2-oxoglutarate dehydrogenase complex dihydrolipoamide acyltransferase (E2) component